MNTYAPKKFQPGHLGASLGQREDPVLDSPLVSLAANVGAVVVGVTLINLKVDDKPIMRAWSILGYGLAAIGVIRGLNDFVRIGK